MHEQTVETARAVLAIVETILPSLNTVLDVGCGQGTWLSVALEKGSQRVVGIDGEWVDPQVMQIPRDSLTVCDLSKPFTVEEKFDLAMSLEVAEHLPAESAAGFVSSLTKASDFVLFSAAIPFQVGTHHVNCRWPEYWAGLFREHDYLAVDEVRPRVWNDVRCKWWYRQNILLFVKAERQRDLRSLTRPMPATQLSLVHPDWYYTTAKISRPYTYCWEFLPGWLQHWSESFFVNKV